MTITDMKILQAETVDAVKPHLAELDTKQLEELRALEVAEGEAKTRATLISAIDARLKALADNDLQAALAAEKDRLATEAAKRAEDDASAETDRLAAIDKAAALYAEATADDADRDVRAAIDDGAHLYFSEGPRFLPGMPAVAVDPGAIRLAGDRLVIERPVDFASNQGAARVEAVWLHVGGAWASSRLMQPLAIGGGNEARLPAGHLAFAAR